jgi:hypothetical protein
MYFCWWEGSSHSRLGDEESGRQVLPVSSGSSRSLQNLQCSVAGITSVLPSS